MRATPALTHFSLGPRADAVRFGDMGRATMVTAMKWLGAAGTLALFLAPRGATATSIPAPMPDTVALSFAWKPGMQASVTTNRKRTRNIGAPTVRTATLRYKLRVEPDTGGLRIRFEDHVFEHKSDDSPAATRFGENAAGLMPDFVVAKDGEFQRIHDVGAYQARFRVLLRSMLANPEDSTTLQGVQAALTSEAVLSSAVKEYWNAVVGTWVGVTFEAGETYGYSSKEPIAFFPGQQVQMNYSFMVKRRLPCSSNTSAHPCVELEMRSVADPENTKRMIETMFEKFSGGVAKVAALKTLAVENVILLVTEPNGLIPHRMKATKTVKGTMSVEGKDVPIEQVDVTQTEYAYP